MAKQPRWREEVRPTKRGHMSKRRADRITKANGGACYICGSTDGPFDIEHPLQLWMGGTDQDEELKPVCRFTCHKVKSAKDAGERAKVRSLIKKHYGDRKPSRLKGRGFDKTKTKRFNGQIVPRN